MKGLFVLIAAVFCHSVSGSTSSETPPTEAPPHQPPPANWTFGDCVMVSFNLSFVVFPEKNASLKIDLPREAKVNKKLSSCGNKTQTIALDWRRQNVNGTYLKQNLTVIFAKNETSKSYGIAELYGWFYVGEWVEEKTNERNITVNVTYHEYATVKSKKFDPYLLTTPLNRSYLCADPGKISLMSDMYLEPMSSPSRRLNDTVLMTHDVKFDAFRDPKAPKGKFQLPLNCIENRINDVVPIVVGVILAVLVVVVLAAYLIRRRRPRSGYLSV